MLNTLNADSVSLHDLGLQAQLGPVSLIVECARRDAERISEQEDPFIFCELETDDTAFHLVGFASETRRKLYKGLRGVERIGRRSALVVLDCGEVIDVLRAVSGNDTDFFKAVPGVGPKRVGSIIKELHKRYENALPKAIVVKVSNWAEARDAVAITLSEPDPRKADELLQKVAKEGMNAESLTQAALELASSSG